jgi:flagellar hook assembly protein FlgD
MGRMIKSFTKNSQPSGKHQVVWDGTNSNGVRVSSGIYIYRFEAVSLENNERFVKSNKLMLVK